jgi:polar amino acid transport system permease protein
MIGLDFGAVLSQWPLLVKGVAYTVSLTAISAIVGLMLGIVCAWLRVYGSGFAKSFAATYVELIRNTPFIVQLFFIFFGLPGLGVRLSAESASVLAMVINLGAYAAEIIRAGIQATPQGQIDAARSIALKPMQIFQHIVLPQALQKTWPAMVSQIIIVMLGSAVCGQISTQELSFAANLIQSRNFRAFEAFIIATVLYLALSIILRACLNWLGPKFLFGTSAMYGRNNHG